MRLSAEQTACTRAVVAEIAGQNAKVYLFGSRLQDHQRGGDIDLLIETQAGLSLIQRAQIKQALEDRLQIPVDIIAIKRSGPHTAFQKIALAQGVLL